MGIVGATTATYVDYPVQLAGLSAKNTSVPASALAGQVFGLGVYNSALKSTAVAQLQHATAVSTVRMFDYANTDGTTFLQATPTNWTTVQTVLSGWAASDLSAITSWLAANPSGEVILPQNGARTVGSWKGSGYYEMASTATGLTIYYKIAGGYKGAYRSIH